MRAARARSSVRLAGLVGALAAALTGGTAVAQGAAGAAAPLSLEAFAHMPAVASATLSPDGRHVAALVSADGETVAVAIWRTDALDGPPTLVPSHEQLRFLSVRFLKNDRLLVQTLQPTNYRRWSIMTLEGKPLDAFTRTDSGMARANLTGAQRLPGSVQLVDPLPGSDRYILAQNGPDGDVYRVDLSNGSEARVYIVLRTNQMPGMAEDSFRADASGRIAARQRIAREGGKTILVQQIRDPDSGDWEEHFRSSGPAMGITRVLAFTADPGVVLIGMAKDDGPVGVYEYDVRARKVLEPLFAHRSFDVVGVRQDKDLNVLGFDVLGDRPFTWWTDPALAALQRGIDAALGVRMREVVWTAQPGAPAARVRIPEGAAAHILGWSGDHRQVLVRLSGPATPDAFFLVSDGKARPIGAGGRSPDAKAMGSTRLVQYASRDGLLVPAFVTTPPTEIHGQGPYPAIVLAHDGPWDRDQAEWDPSGRVQYFASRGYVVLQPQFRGSTGWGGRLQTAGQTDWGGRMQDDLEDGARWLAQQGLAAPDRIALHGYGYGGYAAFAAAVRAGGPFQCAVAGGGIAVANPDRIGSLVVPDGMLQQARVAGVSGLDPLDRAEAATMPVLIYHGSLDTHMRRRESEAFATKLARAGKPHRVVEIEGAGHPFDTWSPANTRLMLRSVEAFLQTDCGPGGL